MRERMRMSVGILTVALIVTACSAVGSAESGENGKEEITWQDYYNLGVRYLSEGNYEEAIIAFTAAIEIDPNRPEVYVGRGDAYRGRGNTDADLDAALSDYLAAVEHGDTSQDTQEKIEEIYVEQGDTGRAIERLLEGGEIASDSIEEEQLFELLDSLSADDSKLDVAKYLFTDEIVRPSEWTINGMPLWRAGADDIRAAAGREAFEGNNGPYTDENDTAEYGGYVTPGRDIFMVEKETQIFCIGEYRTLTTECREIGPGMSAKECLSLLGLTDVGVKYLVRQMGKNMQPGDRLQGYGYNFAILSDADVNSVWWFYPTKRYIVDGLQWYLQYSFDDGGTGEKVAFWITFICDEKDNISEIYYRNAVNGRTWG